MSTVRTFASADYAPRKELARFAAEGRETWEYVQDERLPNAHGIGVVQL